MPLLGIVSNHESLLKCIDVLHVNYHLLKSQLGDLSRPLDTGREKCALRDYVAVHEFETDQAFEGDMISEASVDLLGLNFLLASEISEDRLECLGVLKKPWRIEKGGVHLCRFIL